MFARETIAVVNAAFINSRYAESLVMGFPPPWLYVATAHARDDDGGDVRSLPLERRKDELKALLERAPFGLALNDCAAGDGPAMFVQACAMGLEGIVSKRRELTLLVGPLAALAQGAEPGEPGGATRGVRGLGKEE